MIIQTYMLKSRAMTRAFRTASAVRNGAEILDFISSPKIRALLVTQAERGSPPVGAISAQLLRRFPREVKLAPVKQFIGMCVRAVLEEEGYRVAEKGVRLTDNLFRTGSVYEPLATQSVKTDDPFETMLTALSEAQAIRAVRILEKAQPGLLRKTSA
jgi:hypothetical protein